MTDQELQELKEARKLAFESASRHKEFNDLMWMSFNALMARLEAAENVCHNFVLLGDNDKTHKAVMAWSVLKSGKKS